MRWFTGLLLAISVFSTPFTAVQAADRDKRIADLAERAVFGCSRSAGGVCRQLRQYGEEGLAALLELKERKQDELNTARWRAAVDAVGGARYSCRSNLFWHTELEQALAESKKSGKPVLSLRMLGKLTDEYSCANSRFFRTTLYSSPEIAAAMREHFVLHWHTVRPVPVMTIDFGDGRVLKRTITGNSAHYLLDESGKPLDVLPGLHAPIAFQRWLDGSRELYRRYREHASPATVLSRYHESAAKRIESELAVRRQTPGIPTLKTGAGYWTSRVDFAPLNTKGKAAPSKAPSGETKGEFPKADRATKIAQPKHGIEAPFVSSVLLKRHINLAQVRVAPTARLKSQPPAPVAPAAESAKRLPTATAATEIAAPKKRIERPLVLNVQPPGRSETGKLTDREIRSIASVFPELRRLDPVTEEIMVAEKSGATRRNLAADAAADRRAALNRLAAGIAEDTVRNEFDFHRQVHGWFLSGRITDVEALDRRVYDELFLMPLDDEWLGLVPRSTYTALEKDGLIRDAK